MQIKCNTISHVQALDAEDEYLADCLKWHESVMGRIAPTKKAAFESGFGEGWRHCLNFLRNQKAICFEGEQEYAERKQRERQGASANKRCPNMNRCMSRGCAGKCSNAEEFA